MTNKRKVILGCLIGAMLVLLIVMALITNHNSENKNEDNISSENDNGTQDLPSQELVSGLQIELFDATNDRTYNFTLSNKNTGDEFQLTTATFKDITFDFYEAPANDSEPTASKVIKYKGTQLHVETDGTPSNVLVFGATNENANRQYIPFEEGRIIYISYQGDDTWAICGVDTSMTQEQVIELWGEPTQELNSDMGYSMEWYILRDGHTYFLNTIFDSKTGEMMKIILNIDNHPVFR